MSKVVHIVGARPQFIKLAPVLKAFHALRPEIHSFVLHTGQHYDYQMSRIFFKELELPDPDVHLGIGSGSHAYQTGEMLKGIEAVLLRERPLAVIVYGDTNSTLAGALAAAKLHIPVAHIEAGLRSYNRRMPEEINRIVTDHLSTWLFCPTPTAVENLGKEGLVENVYHVGDVMYDAVLQFGTIADQYSHILKRLNLLPKSYGILTVHRAENTDEDSRLLSICRAAERVADQLPIVFPIHPRTRKHLHLLGWTFKRVRVVEPLSYFDMLHLVRNARLVLTDSGGLQKESFFLGVPCLTLRDETEWPETLQGGWNRLVGTEESRIVRGVAEVLSLSWSNNRNPPQQNVFGSGKASVEIARVLVRDIGI